MAQSSIASIKKLKGTKPQEKPVVKSTPIKNNLIAKVTPRNKANLVENVISHREVKYIYPADVVDTLSRKSWRQKVRDELNKLKLIMADITNMDSKEYKAAAKKYNDYKKSVLKD